MSLIYKIWENFLVNDIYKRKKYEENSVYYIKRDVRSLSFFAASQLYYSYNAKKSKRRDELKGKFSPDYNLIFKKIDNADIVSFDIFDTLLFRPVSKPTDLYYFVERDLQIPDFKRMRIQAENNLKNKNFNEKQFANCKIIYDYINHMNNGITEADYTVEEKTELNICFKNDTAFRIYQYAKEKGKKMICVSDMYHSSEFLKELLENNGYVFDDIIVSCEYFCNKMSGELQKSVINKYPNQKILHIGDNPVGDIKQFKRNGFDTFYLPNVNKIGHKYRAYVDYNLEGSVVSGIVNAKRYSGLMDDKSKYYKYGYMYLGALTLGFADWLKDNCLSDINAKVLFVGRDCKVVKDIFDLRYPDSQSEYFETSRLALLPLEAAASYDNFLEDAFKRRFFDKNYTIQMAFDSVGINVSLDTFSGNPFANDEIVTREKWYEFKQMMYENSKIILDNYKKYLAAFDKYIGSIIGNSKKIVIVDLGWRGTSIIFVKKYLEMKNIDIEVKGAMFGSSDSYISQNFIMDGTIKNYIFGPFIGIKNTFVGKKEIHASDNLYFMEYAYTSLDNSVVGYEVKDGEAYVLREKRDLHSNVPIVNDIHMGIKDFCNDFINHLGKYAKDFRIDSDIAYMPFVNFMKKNSSLKFFDGFSEDNVNIHDRKKVGE